MSRQPDRNAHLSRLMRTAVVMLHTSADDVAAGHYNADELAGLADGLDTLVSALRADSPVVIEGER